MWAGGFTGPNRFRTSTSQPAMNPYHLLYAAGPLLVSHLEIVTVTVTSEQNQRSSSCRSAKLAGTRVRPFSDRHLDR